MLLRTTKPRLRHHALDGIDEQERSVHHAEDPFNFSPKVRVTRCVDQLDSNALKLDRGVLGGDRDPALALQIPRIHHPVADLRMSPKGSGVTEKAIDKSGLAVIDVGDNRKIT